VPAQTCAYLCVKFGEDLSWIVICRTETDKRNWLRCLLNCWRGQLCLCVCTSHVTVQQRSSPNFTHQSAEELIKFRNSSAHGSGSSTVLKDSLTLRDTAFCNNFADISGKKIIRSSWKFYHRHLLGQGRLCYISQLIGIQTEDLDSGLGTLDTEHIRTSALIQLTYIMFHSLSFDLDLNFS